MEPKVETGHAGGFILSEASGSRSRENVNLAGSVELKAGQVIALLASGSDAGDYAAFNAGGSDGSENAKGISINDVDSSTSEQKIAIIARDAEVNGKELIWPDGITDNEKAAGIVELTALGIIVRLLIVAVALGAMLIGAVPAPSEHGMLAMSVVGFGILDIFRGSAFSVQSLTDAINKIPFVPGRLGQIIPWNEAGITTLSVMIEEKSGVLNLIQPTPRGGPGETIAKQKRTARQLTVPHIQRDDAVYADEVQGIRAFGSETQLETVQGKVNERFAEHVNLGFDPTLEWMRVGAMKGIILNPDLTVLYNLFTEFGVAQPAEINFALGTTGLRKRCAQAVRLIADALGGVTYTGVMAECGNDFFDALLENEDVVNSYKNTDMASVLRSGYIMPNGNKIYGAFEFGGIIWENYRGKNGANDIVHTDKCHLFPVGVPGLFKTVFAPADYIETVNTVGLPRYAKQIEMRNGKGIELEMQSNPLCYCTRPAVLIQGRRA